MSRLLQVHGKRRQNESKSQGRPSYSAISLLETKDSRSEHGPLVSSSESGDTEPGPTESPKASSSAL